MDADILILRTEQLRHSRDCYFDMGREFHGLVFGGGRPLGIIARCSFPACVHESLTTSFKTPLSISLRSHVCLSSNAFILRPRKGMHLPRVSASFGSSWHVALAPYFG